ncbi:MAG: M28 family peptidase, partial [Planctomycetes bacterium]|nr:M28 family peptidase [Planctomycetota bacterium]
GNRIAGKSSVEVTVEGDGAPPSVVSAARNLLLDSTGATVDLTFNEAVDPEAVGDLSNYQIKGKRQLKKVALLGDGRVARLTFDAPVGKAPPTKALVALAVLALLASLLASWLLGISSRAAAMTVRLVFLLIAVALIVVVATGAAGTGVRVFHVRDLAGNERAVAVAPLIETLEPAAPRLASAKAAISADGSRKSFSVAFDKSVDPAAATDAKNFTLECPVGSAIDLKGAKMEYDPETFTATVDLSSRAADVKGLKLGDEFRIAVANVRDVHGNAIAANSHVSGKIGGDFNPPKPLQAFQDLELDLVQLKEDAELASGIKAYASGVKKGFTVDVKFDKPLDKKSAEDTANYVLFGGPRTKLALLQEDEKTVRVIFAAAVVPDQTTILMRNIKDTLGNFMPPVSDFPIVSSDKVLPKLLRVQSTAVSGPFNDTISVMFNEELVADDGKALGNFKVESPIGKAIDLAGSGVSYNAAVSTTTITLAQRDDKALNLRPGDSIKVTVSNVRDIAGNKIVKESVITGSVRGDTTKPQLVSVTQNTAVDETGATVDVQFDEAVDVASAKQLALYAFSGGQKALQAVVKSPETPVDQELLDALATLSDERSRAGLARFESFESRIPGYPGNRKAYDHIVSEFKRLGYKPVTETFRVPVPVQRGENKLTLLGESGQPEATMPLYCLWPNKVQTSTLPKDGLTGHLVYGGKGEFIDFTGQEIMGSIVLLDFDSADNYVNARMLGAQAIIFFDNGGITMGQAYDKFMEVPADVPRFWINKSEAQRLLPLAKKNRRVTLNARMDWVDAETWNVYALLEGSDEKMPVPGDKPKRWKDNIIVVSAYYDSMSVVPSLAPGADSASGITALLEVARVLKHEYPPKASFVFLATSGHFEGLRGMSDFVYRHARKSKYYLARMAVKDKIEVLFSSDKLGAIKDPGELEKAYEAEKRDFRLLVALDLSTHNDQVAAFAEGTYQNWWWGTDNYKQNAIAPFAKKFLEYQDNDEAAFPVEPDMAAKKKSKHVDYLESRKYLNAVTPSKRSWRHYMHTPLGLDHEVVTFVGHFGMGMATAHDTRVWMDTPLDTVANANVTNLTTQIRTLAALFAKAGRDEKFFPDSKLEMKDRGHNLKGNIVWFDRKVNHFVPKASIGGALVTYQLSAERSRSAVRTLMTSMTCEDDPHAGDEQKGFRVTPITSDAKRIHVAVWNRALKDVTEHKVVVETRYGTFAYPLRLEDVKEGRWVADINMAREIYGPDSFIPCSLACGIPLILLLALLFGVSQMPKALRYILWILVTIDVVVWAFWFVFVLAIQVDNRIGEKKEDLNLSWEHGIVKEIVLRSQQGESRHENIDVSFGNFKGQFKHRIRRHPWGLWAMAYKLDDEGRIVFAADRGQEGEKTYPILS